MSDTGSEKMSKYNTTKPCCNLLVSCVRGTVCMLCLGAGIVRIVTPYFAGENLDEILTKNAESTKRIPYSNGILYPYYNVLYYQVFG